MDPAPASSPPFEVIETERGKLYRLPQRKLGVWHLLALVPSGTVLLLGVFLGKFYVREVAQRAADSWYWAVFVVLLLGWGVVAYLFLDVAASLLYGHSEVEVAPDGTVRTYDRAGWFRFPLCWFKPWGVVRLILTEILAARPPNAPRWSPAPAAALWQLSAEGKKGERGWIAIGYPREVLAALAAELAPALAVAPPEAAEITAAAAVPVVVEDPERRDVFDQPPKSRVKLERHPDGVTLTFPRCGFGDKSGGVFGASLIFIALGGVALGVCIHSSIRAGEFNFGIIPSALFVGLGCLSALASIDDALEKIVLAVVGDRLLTFRTSLFGSQRREIARAEILDIACGTDRTPANRPPVADLRIVAPDWTVFVLLAERDQAELKWVATVLRQALGIPSEPPYQRKPPADKPWAAEHHRL